MTMERVTTDKLQQESNGLTAVVCLGALALFSGVLLLLPIYTITGLQLNWVLHTLLGSLLTLPLLRYCLLHFTRTVGIRSPLLIFSGLMACLLVLVLLGSGFWMAVHGQSEHSAWIGSLHGIAVCVFLGLCVIHLIAHRSQKRKKQPPQKRPFITLSRSTATVTGLAIGLYSVLLVGAGVLPLVFPTETASLSPANSPTNSPASDYVLDYGSHPFRPSQTETASGGFVLTEQIAKSQQCGSCHTDIYEQWLSSTHRQAASDPAYVKNINLLEKNRGITATRYCEGCHAPVALLTGELTPGGKHGGIPDTPAHVEGVGCMGCHGISDVVHLNGTASYVFDPKEFYLFENSTHPVAQRIRNFLIRLNPDPHKAAMGPELMQSPTLCASCHEQFMDKSMNNWGWVKMQSEYHHWLESPFSGQQDQNFQNESALTCQHCHFPLVAGNDPSADENGLIHSHRSLGANTVLPLLNGDKEQLDATIAFLQSARVLVDIEEPKRSDTLQSHQFVNQELRPQQQDNTPFFFYLGEEATLRVVVTNRMVGHNFPAGTTDINQAWLHFTVTDADNQTVYESGALNDALELDKTAHIYHSIPVDRTGKAIWKHDLFRMVGDSYKNVIAAGKSDIKDYRFTVPSWAKEPLTATVIVKYRKFNQRYARWALDHERPVLPVVEMARDALTLPLKLKPVTQKQP